MLHSAVRSGAVTHLMNSSAALRSAGVLFLKRYQLPPPVGEPRCFEARSEEHTSELQSRFDLVCRLLLEKKKLLFSYYRIMLPDRHILLQILCVQDQTIRPYNN